MTEIIDEIVQDEIIVNDIQTIRRYLLPASKTNLGGVYAWEDEQGFHLWLTDPMAVEYTEENGVYNIKTMNYTEQNGIYNIGGNE